MSWSFRTLALSVVLAWGLVPQLACFMPDQARTKSEMDCCEGMSSADCNSANMHDCCQTVVRTNFGVAMKVVRNVVPPVDAINSWIAIQVPVDHDGFRELSIQDSHAPPPDPVVSSSILRI
jgi:hypothetical protein